MKHFAISMVTGIFLFSAISANALLPENWHDIYPPGDGWRIVCDIPGTNGSMIYFKPAMEKPGADDILVRIIYSHRMCWLYIAPYDGECDGGEVVIDGKPRFGLESEGNYCVSACGRNFTTSENSHKNTKAQSIAMFGTGKQLDITMNTKDGRTISTTIPLDAFTETYSELESGKKCGVQVIQP